MAENRCFSSSTYQANILTSRKLYSCLKDEKIFEDGDGKKVVTFDSIRQLSRVLDKTDKDKRLHIHQLLNGSQFCFSEPPVVPRNPELEARIQEIKNKLEKDEYSRITEDVDPTIQAKYVTNFRSDVRMLRSHMAASANFVITVGACFLFGYKVIEYVFPRATLAGKLLFGIITGAIGALADLYFLLKHLDQNN